jgi:hypothetical protein
MDILFIVVLGFVIASVMIGPIGWRHSRTSSVAGAWLFVVLAILPLLWLASEWIPPAGPAILGVYWVGPVAAGVLLMLLLAAAAPPPHRLKPQ